MGKSTSKIKKALIFAFPLICGTYGLAVLEGMKLSDAVFTSVCMYTLEYQDSATNIFIEMARWTAPLVTASGVILVFGSLKTRWKNWMKYLRGNSIAVYGTPEDTSEILEELGKRGIDGKDRFVKAERYILLGNEEENFCFYIQHQKALADHMLYLKCSSVKAQTVQGANLKLFCPEETAARLFWKKSHLYQDSAQKNHHLKLILIGENRLTDEVLYWGLQDNLFHPDQQIEYHIFGNDGQFEALHHELHSISDQIIFHSEPWYRSIPLFEEADRIIVCTQENQGALLRDILFAISGKTIDVFLDETSSVNLLEEQNRLRLFDWKSESQKLENILDEVLLERAKRINLRYCNIYSGTPETNAEKEVQWNKLDAFTRYSNVSAADYHEIRLQMLSAWGLSHDYTTFSTEDMEILSELEHIRWCRYHYLNNWKFGLPADGKNKDKALRIHEDLIPYRTLSEEDKEKDRENIRILMSME